MVRHIRKIIIGVILSFILFTITGFFIAPPILKSILVKELSKTLNREVSIEEIKINPYVLSATAKGILVKEREAIAKGKPFFSLDELFINLQGISALRRTLILKEIRIIKPQIYIKRNSDLTFNFSDLFETKEKTPSEAKRKKPFLFSFNNIRIEDGSIDFWDEPKKTKHTLRELKVGIPFLSNIPYYIETFVKPSFSVKINDTLYELNGQTKPFHDSMETNFEIHIRDLNIPYYLAYAPIKMNFKIPSALLDASLRIQFLQSKTKKPSLIVSGDISIKKIAIDEIDNKPLLRVPSLDLKIASLGPLINQFHLSRVSIQSPEINVMRKKDETINLTTLLPEKRDKEPLKTPSKKEAPLWMIEVDEIQITNGKIHFEDLSREKPFKTLLFPVEVKIDHFTNRKGEHSTYSLSLNTEAKEIVDLSGEFTLEPLWTEGSFNLRSIPLKKYFPYYQEFILFNLEAGQLDLSTRYYYVQKEKEPEIGLSRLNLQLKDLRLKKPEEEGDFLKIPVLGIKEADLHLIKQEIKIGHLRTEKGEIRIIRQKDGSIDLLKLFPSRPVSPKGGTQEEKVKKEKRTWMFFLKEIFLNQYQLLLEDQVPKDRVHLTLDKINIKGENLSTNKNSQGKILLSLLLNRHGSVSMAGMMGIDPLQANLKVTLNGIPIPVFQPYVTEKLRIHIPRGNLSTTGELFFSLTEAKEPRVQFKGDLSLTQFVSTEKRTGEDLLKWDSLNLENLNFDFEPLRVRLAGISLSDFYARIILYPEGKLNIQEIIVKEEPPKETPSPPSPQEKEEAQAPQKSLKRQIQIETVTLQGGRIEFFDRSLDPPYSAKLVEIGGRVSGLSSEETTLADLELRGKLDEYAPLEIIGKINPLKEDLFVDLKVRFKDMDLTSMTPYSGKYVGYTIEKGKLSFDLKYLIEKRKLDSQNYIFLDQFTLGEKVESPHATKLPVKLAIALLKDRNGVIKLDIPIRGTLDDPKFSIWKIILQILINLITKAATSPFALLGAIVGGGEELSYVEFEEGTLRLDEVNLKKVENLTRVLRERPAVKLEIEGHVDLEKDREGLKRELFLKKLKAQKLNEMIRRGQGPTSIDEVRIESEEYSRYLKMAYREERFPKPRDILGRVKELPDSEMEKLIFTHIEVKEGDLRTLALQRAQKIKEMILNSKEIEPERIFLVEPKNLAPEKKEKIKNSRVDFKIK